MPPLRLLALLSLSVLSLSPAGGQAPVHHQPRGGGRAERIKVLFTPTVCKVRCSQGRCTNFCERGNVTTLYNSELPGDATGSHSGAGFRVFLCPMLCKNGGVCIQKDRCLCPPTFTGKFCHIPITSSSSTNDIEKPPSSPAVLSNGEFLTQSEYILPLGSHPIGQNLTRSQSQSGAPVSGSSMVKVRVQHPAEASVKIHQVLKVGYGPNGRENSETVTWSSGNSGSRTSVVQGERSEAEPPSRVQSAKVQSQPPKVQAQTLRGEGTYTEASGFKYCFREVRNGQCSSPLPGLRSQDSCCRGLGKAWGINECVLCPPNAAQNVISEVKDQCYRVLDSGRGPGSCSLHILKNITKQICCCSRVGKAWGQDCERCPYFGSVGFKEICPAGPGYHYSASAIQFNQRVAEQHGTGGPPVVPSGGGSATPQQPASGGQARPLQPASTGSNQHASGGHTRAQQPASGGQSRTQQPASTGSNQPASVGQARPLQPASTGSNQPASGGQARPLQPASTGSNQPVSSGSTRTQHPTGSGSASTPTRPQHPSSTGSQTTPLRPLQPSSRGLPPLQTRPQAPAGTGSQPTQIKPGNGGSLLLETSPAQPSSSGLPSPPTRPQQPSRTSLLQPQQPVSRGSLTPSKPPLPASSSTARPARVTARPPTQTHRPSGDRRPVSPVTQRPDVPRPVRGVCETRPQVCGRGRCVDQPGGRHICVCDEGYQPSALQTYCHDVDECRRSPPPCGGGRCQNTEGSYRCICPTGYNSDPQGTSCSDVDECQQAPSPCPNGRCDNTPGSFKCVCRPGYKLEGNACTDVDECEDPLRCPGQECVNSAGSYRCLSCQPGFGLLNGQCSDIDECRQSPCANGRCENTPGSFKCVCRTGYKLQGNTCTDVDECEDPLRCPGQECVNSAGSYRCLSCQPGFGLLNGQCSDIDECRQSPCANGRCENTPGSFKCVCRTGYKLQGNTCTDVDECLEPSQCPGQTCINSQGSYRCVSCKPGFQLTHRQCTDVDECSQTPSPCANGRCENLPGSYTCVCQTGYSLQDNTCEDVDECGTALRCPGQECVNSQGSFTCVACKSGFQLTDGQCSDVDECGQKPCTNGRCENTPGSFKCVCRTGFILQDTNCTDIDECAEPSQCPGQECVNSWGSYRCVPCRAGHSVRAGVCSDVDECEQAQACSSDRVCVNTDGSYRCDCQPGYRTTGLGRHCRDINECLEGSFCFPQGECVNALGSYSCVCAQGYTTSANSTTCQDVDECARPDVCQDGRCVNTEGSFLCRCQAGFTTSPESNACLDVDECVDSGGAVCGSQRCDNTIGSYRCVTSCEPGYHATRTGECVDINECANETVCGEHAFCQNLIGTFQCVCDRGYTSSSDGKACLDEDECETMQGVCGAARCENVDGSFMCECPEGAEFDTRSGQCVTRPLPGRPTFTGSSSSSSSSSASLPRQPGRGVEAGSLAPPRPGEVRECYYNVADEGSCSRLSLNTTQQECCCTLGQGWGLGCQFHPCPPLGTAEHLSLCPSGQGYLTTGPGAFSYRDVDECKLFHPEVCKSGVCVNNIPGYSCYCPSGYFYDTTLLECVDTNECEEEESCPGGICVNTVGSYFCTCEPPLVLDDSQRNCVNTTGLTVDENLSFCWQHVTADLVCQSPLLGGQVTFTECCCLYGEGWGLQCALCPARDSEDFEGLCNMLRPPPFAPPFPDRYGPDLGPRLGPGPGLGPRLGPGGGYPYGPDTFPEPLPGRPDFLPPGPDYDDYSPPGGGGVGFRERPPGSYDSYSGPEGPFRRPAYLPEGYYDGGDYGSPDSAPRPPYRLADPRSERAFGARPPPPHPRGPPLSLAPLPGGPRYEDEEEEEPWRPGPPFSERRPGGEGPRRAYERHYEPYAGLSSEDCGIVRGCENGRCIRVAEGFTCDCYEGYRLDMTSMTCTDVNECESQQTGPVCVNARCVNTEGSFRCICRRGHIMSRRPNHCVAA
ncbi:LOW QUALITY PROTEIN: latent-transforming growth factor beta-binding protein 4 [Osmerus mordax]|uniref:LOW QUALITY PROTEIN: latent-transforming growth factor beta-binding protein 4 n=1 Tax=Osmerus mordax TaxID=8014 RepID=UPI00350F9B15